MKYLTGTGISPMLNPCSIIENKIWVSKTKSFENKKYYRLPFKLCLQTKAPIFNHIMRRPFCFTVQFSSTTHINWGRRKIFFISACEVIALLRHHLHDTWLVRFSLHIEYLEFTEGHWSRTYVSIGHIHQNGLSYLSLIKTHWQHALSLVEYEQVLRQQGWILQSFLKNRAEY